MQPLFCLRMIGSAARVTLTTPIKVSVDQRLESLRAQLLERCNIAVARVIHYDIEAPERIARCCNEANVPLAALVIAISVWHVPESRSSNTRGVDWLGAAIATIGLAELVYGFLESATLGWRHPRVIA